MSLEQLERIFNKEIGNQISRLTRKAAEQSREQLYDESPQSVTSMAHSQLSLRTTASYQTDLHHIGSYEAMARDMGKSMLRRVELATADWGPPDNEDGHGAAPNDGAGSAMQRSLQARHQELLGKLQDVRRQEKEMHNRLLQQIVGGVGARLQVDELEDGSEYDPALQEELLDQLARIKSNIAIARTVSSALEEKRQRIEGIEARQRLPLPPVDAWLAGESCDGLDVSDAGGDRDLCEAIRRGELHCKRLRRHLS